VTQAASLDLFHEFSSLVMALEEEQVEYAVAGGLAVAIWGVPRATQDIDLLVPPHGVEGALAVARRCGFTIEAFPMTFRDGTEIRRVSKPGAGVMLTLDLLIARDNLEPAWASRERVATEEGPLWVVGREALIRMKVAAGRPQDLADVERLTEMDR
jgi:hypothetical protein